MTAREFRYVRRLFHHETDADGVCHFSNYLRIFEEAMMDFLRELGAPLEHAEHSLAVVQARADYLSPLRSGDVFSVSLELAHAARTWFELTATLTSSEADRARMTLKLAATSRATGKPVALTPRLRHLLGND